MFMADLCRKLGTTGNAELILIIGREFRKQKKAIFRSSVRDKITAEPVRTDDKPIQPRAARQGIRGAVIGYYRAVEAISAVAAAANGLPQMNHAGRELLRSTSGQVSPAPFPHNGVQY